jgi:hypothetical protein
VAADGKMANTRRNVVPHQSYLWIAPKQIEGTVKFRSVDVSLLLSSPMLCVQQNRTDVLAGVGRNRDAA